MRVADLNGHSWPITGCVCPECQMPADPDGIPHPSCRDGDTEAVAGAALRTVAELLHHQLGARVIERWLISRQPVDAPSCAPQRSLSTRPCCSERCAADG